MSTKHNDFAMIKPLLKQCEIMENIFGKVPRVQQPAGLIGVLCDKSADAWGDRDDAAMDLSDYDEPEAEEALSKVALDESTDPHLAERCSESLAEIWCRKGRINMNVLTKLRGDALHIAISLIQVRKPEWKSYVESAISKIDP